MEHYGLKIYITCLHYNFKNNKNVSIKISLFINLIHIFLELVWTMTEERNLFRYLIIKKEKKTKTLSCNGKKKKKKRFQICTSVITCFYPYILTHVSFSLRIRRITGRIGETMHQNGAVNTEVSVSPERQSIHLFRRHTG